MSNKQENDNKSGSSEDTKKLSRYESNPLLVRHPNDLTRNFIYWNFTVGENRILVNLLNRIKSHQQTKFPIQVNFQNQITLRYHWRELLPKTNAVDRLIDDLIRLKDKTINLASSMNVDGVSRPATTITGIIADFKYSNDRDYVELNLNSDWYAYLINLCESGFTEYNYSIAQDLPSQYSIKMYYFVSQWLNTKGKKLSLSSFRKEFNIPDDKYQEREASALQRKILIPTKKILDKNADVSFNYTTYKKGRRIEGFSFVFYKTNKKNNLIIPKLDTEKKEELFLLIEKFVKITYEDKSRLVGLMRIYGIEALRYVLMKDNKKIIEIAARDNKTIADAFGIIFYERKTPKLSDLEIT